MQQGIYHSKKGVRFSPCRTLKYPAYYNMFSLELITRAADAEQLLRMAQREKRSIFVRRENTSLRNENASEDGVERAADILTAQAELQSLNAVIDSLPEGKRKQDEITNRMAVELRLRRLTGGTNGDDPISIVERAFDVDRFDRDIAGIDAFVAAVEARKAELN